MNWKNYDNLIYNMFCKDGKKTSSYRKYTQKRDHYPNINTYLENRFDHITRGIKEVLYRLENHIEECPKCKTCGKYINFSTKNIYPKYCSFSCKLKDPEFQNYIHQKSIERYGSINNSKKISERHKVHTKEQIDSAIKKRRETNLELYGEENFTNIEKMKQTNIERYGTVCSAQSEEVKKKIEENNLRKYGVRTQYERKDVREKISESNKRAWEKKTPEEKEKLFNNIKKVWKTKSEDEIQEIVDKRNHTKDINHTHNKSHEEDRCYDYVKILFPNTIRHYKEYRYNYECDFYIPELDVFIEYQGSWTHGHHPFNPNDEKDVKTLNKWKAIGKKYYSNASDTWSIRDPKKRETAKKNNLKYYEIWSEKEFKEIIDKLYDDYRAAS